MKKIFIIALLINLVGCTLKMKVEDYSDAEYGSPDNVEELVKDFIISIAKNPDSVVIKNITKPRKTLVSNTNFFTLFIEPFIPVWGVCATYKATNSYGGYIQNSENYYVKDNKVLYSIALDYGNDIPTLSNGFKPCGY